MTGTRYERNEGFELELERDPRMVAHVRTSTTTVAVTVRGIAPRGKGAKAGSYRRKVRPRDNRVVSEDFAWHWVEYGSVNNQAYAPLRKGVLASGCRFVATPKT